MKSIQINTPTLGDVIPASKKSEVLTEVKKTLALMLIGGTLHKDDADHVSQALFHISNVLEQHRARKEGGNG